MAIHHSLLAIIMTTKSEIIREARSWIGTRFHHQGRVKKNGGDRGGCDCIGLIIGVADNVGLTCHGRKYSEFDRSDYARTPDGSQLQAAFAKYLREIPVSDIEPGDILMFRFDKDPQHVGIVSNLNDHIGLIHCYMQARGVVEHGLDDYWKERIVAAFEYSY